MKILIVNAILIGDQNATGITMENMLLGIPGVEYLQFCIDYRKEAHRLLAETIFLASSDSLSDNLIYWIKKRKGGGAGTSRTVAITNAYNSGPIKDAIKGLFDILPCKVSQNNIERIKMFNPDLIYTMGANVRVMKIACDLSDLLKVPIVFHCMDDWRSTIYMRSTLSKPFNTVLRKQLKEINKRSVINLGICKKMADFYACEYQRPYSYASNCVFEFNEEPYCADLLKPMKVLFSGGLHFHRGDRLKQVGEVVEQLNKDGKAIDLYIFAPLEQAEKYTKAYESLPHTHCYPYVAKEKQVNNLMSADVLLHVESDNDADNRHMKYSFSTKLVEYFAAGRAVLGFGDRQLSSIDYIDKMSCGVTAENPDELKKCLSNLYNKPDARKEYAKNALDVAIMYHSQKAVQKKILGIFKKATSSGRGDI